MRSKNIFLKIILFLGDLFFIYSSLILTLAIRQGDFSFLPGEQTKIFLFHFSLIALFWFIFLYFLDFYEIPPLKKTFDFLRNLLIFVFLAGFLGTLYFYLRPEILIAPKIILFLHVLFSSFFIYLWRFLIGFVLRHKNFRERAVIVGFVPGMEEIIDKKMLAKLGYEISAFFSSEEAFLKKLLPFKNLAKNGIISNVKELKEIIIKEKIELIILPYFLDKNDSFIAEIFGNLPLNLNYINFTDFYEKVTGKVAVEAISEAWLLANLCRAEEKLQEAIKRVFDIVFSLIGLFVFLVIFPLVALLIKVDSLGSIFYTQKRVGKNGKIFSLYKFRTMIVTAEKDGPQWAKLNDSRVTRVGKILRKTHLDELPQFYNILKSDISFVGPRPERPEFIEKLKEEIDYYDLRNLIKPGFTGWAQINYGYGASVDETKEKLKYDFYYIKNRNFFFDLGIILKTIRTIFDK